MSLFTEETIADPIERVKRNVELKGNEGVDLVDLILLYTRSPEFTEKCALYSASELLNMTYQDFLDIGGISKAIAKRLELAIAMGRKITLDAHIEEKYRIRSPQDCFDYLKPLYKGRNQEEFIVLCLNTKNEVIHHEVVFRGSLNMSVVHPREVYRLALKKSAASIIVAHQHPSGDPNPSQEDIEITKKLVEAGKYIGIDVLDHCIIGDRCISLKEKGYL